MSSSHGGFYSSQDADSEGEEGRFYVWSFTEIQDILDPDILEPFCKYFGVFQGGNFEGKNILNIQSLNRFTEPKIWIHRRCSHVENT